MSGNHQQSEPPPRRRLSSIHARLVVWFSLAFAITLVLVGLVDFFGVPLTPYAGRFEQHRLEAKRSLDLIADLKEERLLRWLRERRDDGHAMQKSRLFTSQLERLRETVRQSTAQGTGGPELRRLVQEQAEYANLQDHIVGAKNTHGVYERILAADAATGTILISTEEEEVGEDVSKRDFFTGPMEFGDDYVSDVQDTGQRRDPVLFISHVLPDADAKPMTILVTEVNCKGMLRPILQTGEGLGPEGEALLVDREARILASLKHPLSDGTRPQALKYRISAEPARRAVRGQRGIIESEDYRGEPVLAAYRHIQVPRVTPESGWGLVVKRDRAELLAPLRRDALTTLLVGVIGMVVAVGLTIAVARSVTRPIRALSRVVHDVAAGDLAARAPENAPGELGMLSATFNAMIDRIQHWQEDLEAEVHSRTAQLTEANERLNREIADRERMEEALRESEANYREIFNAANDAIFVHDVETGAILDVNRATCEMFGYPREKMLDLDVQALSSGQPPYTREHVAEWIRKAAEGEPQLLDWHAKHKSGHLFWVEISLRRATLAGKVRVLAILRDVTERKRAEEELKRHHGQLERLVEDRTAELRTANQSLQLEIAERKRAENDLAVFKWFLEAAEQALGMADLDGNITYANAALCRLLGRATQEDALGTNILEYYPEGPLQTLEQTVLPAVKKQGQWTGELPLRSITGKITPCIQAVFLIRDENETPCNIANVITDITQRKLVEEELARHRDHLEELVQERTSELARYQHQLEELVQERTRELEEAQEALIRKERLATLGQLTATVSHELRNPLGTIRTSFFAITQQLRVREPKLEQALQRIERSIVRCNAIIADLLDYSRSVRLDRRRTDVDAWLHVLLGECEIPGCVELKRQLACGVHLPLDRERFGRCLVNLVANASQAMEPRGGLLAVTSLREDRHLVIRVADTGCGIPPDHMDKVFEPLYSTKSFGVGLGLPIVRQIVEHHGGTVEIESQPGRGTCVTVRLPI